MRKTQIPSKSTRENGDFLEVEALSASCKYAFEQREHGCFGISPFNSYFSEDKIRELAAWGKQKFKFMHFFIPDVPAIYTLQAQGYTPEKAEWKARRQAQYLKNKIRKALASLLFEDQKIQTMILDWERLVAIPRYNHRLEEITALFKTDPSFRAKCLGASRWVLSQKATGEGAFSEASLLMAVQYFLAELPLFADTAGIVGAESSVFCYHQRVGFLEEFYARQLAYRPRDNQGFLILKPTSLEARAHAGEAPLS